jgi:hypothetical protein
MDLSRRSALVAGAVAGLAVAAGEAVAAPALDLSSKAGRLNAYMRMCGGIDEKLAVGYLTGAYYGVVDGEVTPLYGLLWAVLARYRKSATGGYAGVKVDQAYYTDLDTGKVFETWRNPYTGEDVKPIAYKSEPVLFTIDEDLTIKNKAEPAPGVAFDQTVQAPVVVGNDVWFTEKISVTSRRPGAAKPTFYTELATTHARRDELAARHNTRVRSDIHFTASVSWSAWLKMGDRPGNLLGNAEGAYGAGISDLPEAWVEATLRNRPELVHDPLGVLEPGWKSLAG